MLWFKKKKEEVYHRKYLVNDIKDKENPLYHVYIAELDGKYLIEKKVYESLTNRTTFDVYGYETLEFRDVKNLDIGFYTICDYEMGWKMPICGKFHSHGRDSKRVVYPTKKFEVKATGGITMKVIETLDHVKEVCKYKDQPIHGSQRIVDVYGVVTDKYDGYRGEPYEVRINKKYYDKK